MKRNLTIAEEMFLKRLKVGESNAVYAHEMGFTDKTVMRYVSELRKNGIPICDEKYKYWIADEMEYGYES